MNWGLGILDRLGPLTCVTILGKEESLAIA